MKLQPYCNHHVIFPPTPHQGPLLLADLSAAQDPHLLAQHNIKTIITASAGLQYLHFHSSITHIVFPLLDLRDQNVAAYFDLSHRTIEQNRIKGGVLIHCGAGITRSATLVLAYYMKKEQAELRHALKYILRIREDACPNLEMQLQLKEYQLKLIKERTVQQGSH